MSADNYRTISLLPQLSKILEKLIKVRFTSYLNKYNIISDWQYGFRANMSTSDALIDTIELIQICYWCFRKMFYFFNWPQKGLWYNRSFDTY